VQESYTVELPESFFKKRKKRGKPQDWNKNFQKTKRLEGKEYFGKKKLMVCGNIMYPNLLNH